MSQSSRSARSSSMTKEQLKNALIQHGVPSPPGSAKKDEFQRQYDEKVLPLLRNTEFSSDEDEPEVNGDANSSQVDGNVQYTEEEVRQFNDDELFQVCSKVLGPNKVGPIVDSTRQVYRNLLLSHLKKNASPVSGRTNGRQSTPNTESRVNGAGTNGYSDSDDDAELETASRASRASQSSSTAPRGRPRTSVKKEVPHATVQEPETHENLPRNRRQPSEPSKTTVASPAVDSAARTNEFIRRPLMRTGLSTELGYQNVPQGVSYFKERPGYASTTTSNVLPSKPVGRKESLKMEVDEDKVAFDTRRWTQVAFALLASVIISWILYNFGFPGFLNLGDRGQLSQDKDELDQLLETLEEP